MAKVNEQLLKNVKPQEVNSLVQLQGELIQHLETDCEICLQRFETLEIDFQVTKVSEDASLWRRVSNGMSYKTIPDVDGGLEIEPRHEEN